MNTAALSAQPTPALVVDRAVMEYNIAQMAQLMKDLGVALRPHWKTSKMVEAARLQEREGCVGFTCATPAEVECLLDHGYNDLTWAHQPVGAPKVWLRGGGQPAGPGAGGARLHGDGRAPVRSRPSGRSGRSLSDRGGHRFGDGPGSHPTRW